jgi:hypothetical protein
MVGDLLGQILGGRRLATTVIVRESGRPSTPQRIDSAPSTFHADLREYWIARLRGQ